jgi:predicted benzoate:H+ symporter BenE
MNNKKERFKFVHENLIGIYVTVYIAVILVIAILLAYTGVFGYNIDYQTKIESTIVNGVLTGTAIVFGFVTFEIREIKTTILLKFFLAFPLLIFLSVTVLNYFNDSMRNGYITKFTMTIATVNFLFNIFYCVLVVSLKGYYDFENV